MNIGYRLLVALLSLSVISTGCQHIVERQVIRQEMIDREEKIEIIMSATLRDGTTVRFDRNGASYQRATVASGRELCITGKTEQGDRRTIPLSSIVEARLRTREFNGIASTLSIVAISGAVLATLAAIALSGIRVH